jgi:uncharacterized membrane protein YphA (DoxX/SURF4 family)
MPSKLLIVAQIASFVAFFGYGVACFFSAALIDEFKRWGLEPLRKLTGGLEVLGALGLLAGFVSPIIRTFSATGLALMMVCALFVRAKMRDRPMLWVPATVLLGLNAFIALS